MSKEETALPAIAAIAGGTFIFLQGVIMTAVPLYTGSVSNMTLFYGFFVMSLGLISIVLGSSIYSSKKIIHSSVIVSVAMIAMLFAGGGFLIGSVLTSIGGVLSLLS